MNFSFKNMVYYTKTRIHPTQIKNENDTKLQT